MSPRSRAASHGRGPDPARLTIRVVITAAERQMDQVRPPAGEARREARERKIPTCRARYSVSNYMTSEQRDALRRHVHRSRAGRAPPTGRLGAASSTDSVTRRCRGAQVAPATP